MLLSAVSVFVGGGDDKLYGAHILYNTANADIATSVLNASDSCWVSAPACKRLSYIAIY